MGCLKLPYLPAEGHELSTEGYDQSEHTFANLRVTWVQGGEGESTPDPGEESKSGGDYYPFGLSMPGRSFSGTGYRYGFNGKEKDDNGEWGATHYDYGFRIYNPSIAKFLSVDPLTKSYPMLTPYQFASNTPIRAIDLDGLEAASFQFEIRGMAGIKAISITSSSTIGLLVVRNTEGAFSISSFITPTLGGGAGKGFTVGFSGSFYPTVTNPEQLSGLGANLGAFAGIGLPIISGQVEGNVAFNTEDGSIKGGGSLGPGFAGFAIGGGVYGELSYTEILTTLNLEEFNKNPFSIFGFESDEFFMELGLSSEDLRSIGNQLVKEVVNFAIPEEINRLKLELDELRNSKPTRAKPSKMRSIRNKILELESLQEKLQKRMSNSDDEKNE